jgi:hypothetical protein
MHLIALDRYYASYYPRRSCGGAVNYRILVANLTLAGLVTAPLLLSSLVRSIFAVSTTNQTVEYSAAVTGHAVLFAFVVIPLGMFIFPGLLRLPTECYTKNPATQPRVSLIY